MNEYKLFLEQRQKQVRFLLWHRVDFFVQGKGKAGKDVDFWITEDMPEDEKFLRNYILGKQWINPEDKEEEEIPNYFDVVNDIEEDEEELDKQDDFENAYNFRFEEP